VLAVTGVVFLAFGTLTLIAAPIPELRINPWVAMGVRLGFGGITAFLVRLALRAGRLKARLGADALVGSEASAMEPLSPEGHVLVDGEIWLAIASEPVPAGAKLRVVGHEQYLLRVAPAESAATPRTAA
jgi:membrane-bound serine protease (ClpP class)